MKNQNYIKGSLSEQSIYPLRISDSKNISAAEQLLNTKPLCVSFQTDGCAVFEKKNSYIVLDFGKELHGGVRIITRSVDGTANFHITFGESLSEAYSSVGEKNATNDHSPRDFSVISPAMSDSVFGSTGFRFVRIELLSASKVSVQSISAVSRMTSFPFTAKIKTDDNEINKILETAVYTLSLNLQNGYIWDGIKRDRLVWCGDLHQEILSSLYCFGNIENIVRSLDFLRDSTPPENWINTIPSYSAWWVIGLCDYCKITKNSSYFDINADYAKGILKHFDNCISDDGIMLFDCNSAMPFYLDWPTFNTNDAVIGTASLLILAAARYKSFQDCSVCNRIIKKLGKYLTMPCKTKQVRAFQILAGADAGKAADFLEKNGASGFSTFMSYYILTADIAAGGKNSINLIRQYFGSMLSRGATTFWEDFDLSWLENSGRIDALPQKGERDIHGDFGRFCYEGFRHSLCHGWSSGVVSFFIESIIGLRLHDGFKSISVNPCLSGLNHIDAILPTQYGKLYIKINGNSVNIKAPDEISVI